MITKHGEYYSAITLSADHLVTLSVLPDGGFLAWLEHATSEAAAAHEHTRARTLARTMLQLGDDIERTERQLHLVGIPPRIAYEALRWAQTEPMGA